MERRAMLRMDISTLRVSELRTLLASARAQGREALAAQIEAEIAGRAGSRRAKPAPALAVEADEVLPIDVEPAAPGFELELSKADPPAARRWPIGLAVAGLLAAGAAVVWGLTGGPSLPRRQTLPPAPAAAAAPPAPAPRAMTARIGPAPAPAIAEPEPPPPVATAAEPARERPMRLDPCAKPPSPAERLLCSDLALSLLEHEMRDAYGRAMEAGADPVALRESQAEWRRVRDPVGDPQTLAGLYDRRIRELKAAVEAPSPP